MKKLLFLATAIFIAALAFQACADTSKLIPPYHWTYHALSALSKKGLIKDDVTPGKSAYTPEQVVSLIIYALNRIQSDPGQMESDELLSMRQLVNGYKKEINHEGYNFDSIRTDLENYAILAGLPAIETDGVSTEKNRLLRTEAVDSINSFSIGIYKKMAEQYKGNLFISPYSISTSLSMTYAGARGRTETEMEHVLSLAPDIHRSMSALIKDINSVSDDTAVISTANAVWPSADGKFLMDYCTTLQKFYSSSIIPLNYKNDPDKSRRTINKWVEENTKNKIKNIIKEGVLNKDTSMVLTNAIYFKSDWQDEFEPQRTKILPFWTDSGKPVQTMMMSRTGDKIGYVKKQDSELIEIPYRNRRFSMMIILPDKKAGLSAVENDISTSVLKEYTDSAKPQKVRITIPKFKMEQSFELNNVLANMGMPSAFNRDTADFSGMNGKYNLYIGNVLHKTFIEVGEKGTEASAATAVIMMKTSISPENEKIIEFKADRPFIFIIKDNITGTILFIGRYTHP